MSDEVETDTSDLPTPNGAGEDMHIHTPKIPGSLREFLAEIGIIVVGILIALAGEQAVVTLDWSHKVAEARDGLAIELGEDFGQAQLRIAANSCVEKRLDELAAVVDEAARTSQLPPLGRPGFPPYRTWDMGLWRSVNSADTTAHMGRDELKAYTEVYEFIARIDDSSRQELEAWTTLYGLAGPGRRFDPAEAASFRRAISEARVANALTAGGGARARQEAVAWKLAYDQQVFHRYADVPLSAVAVCLPIDAQPVAHYGAAPMENSLESVLSQPITATSNGLPAIIR